MQAPVPGCADWAVVCSEVVLLGFVPAATRSDRAALRHSTSQVLGAWSGWGWLSGGERWHRDNHSQHEGDPDAWRLLGW